LNEVITYLKNLKSYGYPAPAKVEEPKVEKGNPKEPLYTKADVEAIVQSVIEQINKEEK